MMRFRWLTIFLLIFVLASCESAPENVDSAETTQSAELIAPTATAQPIPTATATNAPTPTTAPTPTATAKPDDVPYWDASLPIEARVEDLLKRMTLKEKVGQMTLIENGSITPDGVRDNVVGAILSGGGSGPVGDNSAAAWLEMVNDYQRAALETRLGIPILYGVDAVHGHNNVDNAVIFPHNIGLGATRNADLIFEIGRITALETIATGIYWDYAPVLAVARDIRWGRAYESYGEDPDLVAELGLALMLGLQGTDGETADIGHPHTLLATAKHWVGDGGTGWGTSTTGVYSIDQGVTLGDEEELRRIHISPYLPTLDAGVMNVMASYSSWDGIKMHGHDYLINDVLKDELAFAGFVVSDWQAIDQIPGSYYDDVVTSINAGIDMNMVPYDLNGFTRSLERAVTSGDVSEQRIDDAVRRILTVKFALGLFETPLADGALLADFGGENHRAVAQQAVRESLVLLKNEDGVLPLEKDFDRILIAGQHADDVGLMSGGWTIEWQGKSGGIGSGTSILEAIQATVAPSTDVVFNRFGRFEQFDEKADVGIVVLGERPYAEGIGDRAELNINGTMIERMREHAETVVVILITGRPLVITDELDSAESWVAAWLPGSEGAGITDVIFGDYDFSGTLSFSWQRDMAQLPFDFDNMPTEGCEAPLFPFGYGLTYQDDGAVEVPTCP